MYRLDISCGVLKVSFEIPHKIWFFTHTLQGVINVINLLVFSLAIISFSPPFNCMCAEFGLIMNPCILLHAVIHTKGKYHACWFGTQLIHTLYNLAECFLTTKYPLYRDLFCKLYFCIPVGFSPYIHAILYQYPLLPMYDRVATGLAEKNSLTFPWHFPNCQHKLQSLLRYIPYGDFLQYIQNHIEITLYLNRCFNRVVLKIGQHKRTFSTSWNYQYFVPNIMLNMKTNKVVKKIISRMIFEWGHDLRFCPSSNIICQTMKIMHR